MANDLDALMKKMDVLIRQTRQNTLQIERLVVQQTWDTLGDEKIAEFMYENYAIKFHVPDGQIDAIQRFVILRRTFYEAPLLNEIRDRVPKGGVFIDAGANVGNHTIFFATVCGASAVHSFEPMPHIQNILRKNAALNGPDIITVHPYGLGKERTTAEILTFNPANLGSTHLTPSGKGDIEIRPMDGFDIQDVAMIKIDVEGMQDDVLLGAEKTITRFKPLMVIEAHHRNEERANTKAILSDLDYRVEEVFGPNLLAVPR